uniref:Helicase-associated domain-containing protein n=1 Tax=Odontella aurita TaxID=265563 RepID=A0A7S4N7P3_9STRA|mmetsp:Transcript_50960/g.153216  ORF Transcript_50960/g.153216 Transcript_50960/m.153216 type:complete len:520 (+) Transcript_50960:43-1602(+)
MAVSSSCRGRQQRARAHEKPIAVSSPKGQTKMHPPSHLRRDTPQLAAIALSAGTRHLRLGPDMPLRRCASGRPMLLTTPATSSATVSSDAALALSAGHRLLALSWNPVGFGAAPSLASASSVTTRSGVDCTAETCGPPLAGVEGPSAAMPTGGVVPSSPGLVEESPKRKRASESLPEDAISISKTAANRARAVNALISNAEVRTTSQLCRTARSGDECPPSEAPVKEISTSSGEETIVASACSGYGTETPPRESEGRAGPGRTRSRSKRVAKGPPGRRAHDQIYHTRRVRRTKWAAKGPPRRGRQLIDLPSSPLPNGSETSDISMDVWEFGKKDGPDAKVFKRALRSSAPAGDSNVDFLGILNIGTHISVLWPNDGKYYPAQVTGQIKKGPRTLHTLLYDTGDVETLDLSGESFRVIADKEQDRVNHRAGRKTGARSKKLTWEENFNELKCFVRKYGHAKVPTKFPENQRLANWARGQNENYSRKMRGGKSTLTYEREALLTQLGFVWRKPKMNRPAIR